MAEPASFPWTVVGGLLATAAFVYWNFIRRKKKIVSIRNKVVLITGASSGLGEACATAFYKEGAKVILCARREKELARVKQNLLKLKTEGATQEPTVLVLDLTDTASFPAKVQEVLHLHGSIDILVNNGGISYRGEIIETDLDVDRRVMEVNYFGQVALTKAVLPHMRKQKSGHIVAVSSIQGKLSIPFRSSYSASKHAMQAFFDCLRAEAERDGIEVCILSPGYIQTNLSLSAVTGDGSAYAKMDKTTASGMLPEYVSQQTVDAVKYCKHQVILAPLVHRLAVFISHLLPNVFHRIMAKRAKKQRQEQLQS